MISRHEGDARQALKELGVSRETFERLDAYAVALTQWQGRINLVSPSTIPALWTRHILDSAQIWKLAPQARVWLDLGSGGGLPGIVIASILAERQDGVIHLVESNGKKAAFLRHVSTSLSLPVRVHHERIESAIPRLGAVDIVTARALASLDDLLCYSSLLLKSGATALFPKGASLEQELTNARRSWHFKERLHRSLTDMDARILEISDLQERKHS